MPDGNKQLPHPTRLMPNLHTHQEGGQHDKNR
jgi:hypothetical protein